MSKEQTHSIEIPNIPQQTVGGSIRGIEEQFRPELSTGTSRFTFPLELPKARALTPELVLNYSSGLGNGIFGVGFDLDILNIQRSTKFGVPIYDDKKDTFISSLHGELVEIDNPKEKEDNQKYKITYYRPRVDQHFAEIEFWMPKENASDTPGFWVIREAEGVLHILGDEPSGDAKNNNAVIQHPDNKQGFQWFVSKTQDSSGNQIRYEYFRDSDALNAQCYLKQISYGNYKVSETQEAENQQFAFKICFDYGNTLSNNNGDLEKLSLKKKNGSSQDKLELRQDRIKNYRGGFLLETRRLCRYITISHHFSKNSEANGVITRYFQFHYTTDEPGNTSAQALSCLTKLEAVGCRKNLAGDYITKALPDIKFEYTPFLDNKESAFNPLPLEEKHAPGMEGNYQLVDLYREGLPGILYSDANTALFWRSLGEGKFEAPKPLTQFPLGADISERRYKLMPVGEERDLSFVLEDEHQNGFFKLKRPDYFKKNDENHEIEWENFKAFDLYPTNHDTLSIDMTGDGQADLLVLDAASQPHYFPANSEKGYLEAKNLTIVGEDFPLGSSGLDVLRTFADIYGDGLLHRVQITNKKLEIWPNLGYGKFGKKEDLTIPSYVDSELATEFDARNIYLVDTDGSGTADLVYVYHDRLHIFLNRGGEFFQEPQKITFPEHFRYTHDTRINFGDIFGNATTSILLTQYSIDGVTHCHKQLSPQKPYLLKKITNYRGAVTDLHYTVSTKNYLARRDKIGGDSNDAIYPVLPFAMPVIEKVVTEDKISGVVLTH